MKPINILIFHRILTLGTRNFSDDLLDVDFTNILKKQNLFHNFIKLTQCFDNKNPSFKILNNLVVTFDDGYADNFEVAFPILRKLEISATFFVASGYLNGGWMWNDGIIEAASKTVKLNLDLTELGYEKYPLTTTAELKSCIDDLLNKIKYLNTEKRTDLAKRILDIANVPEPTHLMMTSAQVKLMHQAGMEIGGHTVNHPILTSLDKSTARREINENKEYLESLIGEPLQSFAYPNGIPGKDYGPEHVALVKEAGYKCAVSTDWGRVNKNSDPFQLQRFTPWDRNPWKFMLRLWLQGR